MCVQICHQATHHIGHEGCWESQEERSPHPEQGSLERVRERKSSKETDLNWNQHNPCDREKVTNPIRTVDNNDRGDDQRAKRLMTTEVIEISNDTDSEKQEKPEIIEEWCMIK
jgi:hypothetical protein